MFRWVLILGMLAGPAVAEEWRVLDGAGIAAALTARVLGYQDGALQDFKADGVTIFDAGRARFGRWAVRGDQYCSVWPPSEIWACYDVEAMGLDVRFIARDGSVTEGRYIDLN